MIGLNSKHGKDSWGFITKEQSEGVSEWKMTKRKCQGDCCYTDRQTKDLDIKGGG